MTTTETRLLPKTLVDDITRTLARLRFVRNIDTDHPVIPRLPHPIDCDICTAGRRVDLLLDQIVSAIGKTPKVST